MKRKLGEDFSADVELDRNQLELCAEEQPTTYLFYAQRLADAKAERDRLQERYDLKKARKESDLRASPPKDFKITEGSVNAEMLKDEELIEERAALQSVNSDIYHLEAGVKALEHRKSALDNLVVLWSKGYYSSPDGGPRSAGDSFRRDMGRNLNRSRGESPEDKEEGE